MPRDLFNQDHKSYRNSLTYYKLGHSEVNLVSDLSFQSK
jgi:hypothetical protein